VSQERRSFLDFDLQGAALVAPGPVRVRLLELAASLERAGWIALLVLRIRLPIEGRFRACTMLLGDVGEDRLRLRQRASLMARVPSE